MPLSDSTVQQIETLRARYPSARSAVLPSLWALQHEVGFLSVDGMREVAQLLGLAPSEVQAVSTFYSMYFQKPAGAHAALVCMNVSCALRGATDIAAHMEKVLGVESGGTSADGAFTWEATVECLGACGGAPAMQVDHHFHEDMTPERVDEVLARYRSAPGHVAEVPPAVAEAAKPAKRAPSRKRATVAEAESADLPSQATVAAEEGTTASPKKRGSAGKTRKRAAPPATDTPQ